MSESDNNSNANTSTAAATVSEAGGIHTAVVHPLVLLSVVDHYSRVAKDTKKRVVGILLGEIYKGTVDISNSFAGIVLFVCCLVLLLFVFFFKKKRNFSNKNSFL